MITNHCNHCQYVAKVSLVQYFQRACSLLTHQLKQSRSLADSCRSLLTNNLESNESILAREPAGVSSDTANSKNVKTPSKPKRRFNGHDDDCVVVAAAAVVVPLYSALTSILSFSSSWVRTTTILPEAVGVMAICPSACTLSLAMVAFLFTLAIDDGSIFTRDGRELEVDMNMIFGILHRELEMHMNMILPKRKPILYEVWLRNCVKRFINMVCRR